MNTSLESKTQNLLRKRAEFFQKIRSFFASRNVLEVDTPILSRYAPIDAHIDLLETTLQGTTQAFFHSSPEYAMKKLLSLGIGDIYQMSHVFRDDPFSRLHSPEFMMVEWYRMGMTLPGLIQETLEFVELFISSQEKKILTYQQAFLSYLEIDPFDATDRELFLTTQKIETHLPSDASSWDRDTLLHFLFGFGIEPHLTALTVVQHFPPSQAALAAVTKEGKNSVALRFEVFYQGMELANGFEELRDPQEQKERLEKENLKRESLGKKKLPLDEEFLKALERGIPPCSGVAAGFDRLLLLHSKKSTLSEILPIC